LHKTKGHFHINDAFKSVLHQSAIIDGLETLHCLSVHTGGELKQWIKTVGF